MKSCVNVPDLAFGLFLIALGAIAFALASDLPVGSATSMGPGYVPRGLAILLILFGIVTGVRALFTGRLAFPMVALRPLLLISAAVALFALMLKLAGLALTSVAVVVCAGYAAADVRVRENLVYALALAMFTVGLFVLALGLPMPIWPQW
jgi:hypothetical protein